MTGVLSKGLRVIDWRASMGMYDKNISNMDLRISTEVETSSSGQIVYLLKADHGSLEATFRPEVGWFGIANLDVDKSHRRQGIGKALLRYAFSEAEELDARLIHAAILSRECLDAMRTVFGEEAIIADEEGTYTADNEFDRYDTKAILKLKLPSGSL